MNYLKKYWDLILAIVLTVALTCIALRSPAKAVSDGYIEIEIHNVYSLDTRIELKCDYNNNTKQFDLHKFYQIPGKKVVIISVPNKYKRCQIWPKIRFFGE
jgi:hypothetical protein